MEQITVVANRVGRVTAVTVSGVGVEGGTIAFSASTNLVGLPITYRVYRGAAVVQLGTEESYTMVSADIGQSMRVSAQQGGEEVFSAPFSVEAAPIIPVNPPNYGSYTIYQNDFSTDRTVDFVSDAAPIAYDAAAVYNAADLSNLGATTPGAMLIGGGVTGIVSKYLRRGIPAGATLLEVYLLTKIGASATGGSTVKRIILRFLNSSNIEVGTSLTLSADIITQTLTVPATAAFLEIEIQRRSAYGSTGAICLYYADVIDITSVGPTPLWLPSYPVLAGLRGNIGVPKTLDFSAHATNATGISYSGSESVTSSGMMATITPSAAATATALYFRATKGTRVSRSSKVLYMTTPAAIPLTAGATFAPYVEVGRPFSLSPLNFITGNKWPFTVTVNSAPAWVKTDVNGLLYGIPTVAASAQNIDVTVTDASGTSVNLVWPVTVVAPINVSTPHKTLADGSTIITQLSSGLPATGFAIVHLAAGTYTMGTTYKFTRTDANRIIIIGAGVDSTIITGDTNFNQAEGLEFRNCTFATTEMPTNPNDLSLRSTRAVVGGAKTLAQGGMGAYIRLHDCKVRGIRAADLSAEDPASWCIRIVSTGADAGKYIYANDPSKETHPDWASATLPPSTDPYGYAIYKGGISAGRGVILHNVTIQNSVFPLTVGSDGAAVNITISGTRTDQMRIWGCSGFWVKNIRSVEPRWGGNYRADEHRDNTQTAAVNNAGSALSSYGLVEDCFLTVGEWIVGQGIQQNTYMSNDSYDKLVLEDASRGGYGVKWRNNFYATDAINGVRSAFSDWEYENHCLILDPRRLNVVNHTPSATYAQFQAAGSSHGSLSNSIVNNLIEPASQPWTLTNNINLVDGTVPVTNIFPNFYTAMAYDDPRLAVAAGQPASAARFWINPDSTWGITNPDIGPHWLRTGI